MEPAHHRAGFLEAANWQSGSAASRLQGANVVAMSLAIIGRGWVTPLGSDVREVWRRLLAGEQAAVNAITSQEDGRTYPVFRVAPQTLDIPQHPRLRRSSAISKFAAAAGLAALRDGGIETTARIAGRCALIFAVSNGGVIYTKRFYHDVVESGARAASPLLFPETVFNAPASHLAAILGITGASYTLVGDGAVGGLAVHMAQDLMENEALDYCLVVAAEEADWLLCDAYRNWRLTRDAPPIELFQTPPPGTILSEGAGALLLARSGQRVDDDDRLVDRKTAQDDANLTGFTSQVSDPGEPEMVIERGSAGRNFQRRADAVAVLNDLFGELCGAERPQIVVASANGTFIDEAERRAIHGHCPDAAVHAPKAALGESVGASGIWQIICAVEALRDCAARSAIVSICGMNQQAAGVRLTVAG